MSTCSTCKRIINDLELKERGFEFYDIKKGGIGPDELDTLRKMAGSYEDLFSRRARKFKEWGLQDRELSEEELRQLILKEETFLKRPIIVIDEYIFIGNGQTQVEAARALLEKEDEVF